MILVTDVHYEALGGTETETARAAVVGLSTWTALPGDLERARQASSVAPYVPGRFFERELPCLLPLLRPLVASHPGSTIVVDGYVDLPEGPGLGRHLVHVLQDAGFEGVSVIGVAKSPFEGAPAHELRRGASDTPLFVSASDVEAERAARWVASMAGQHRLPLAVVRADHLARGLARPGDGGGRRY